MKGMVELMQKLLIKEIKTNDYVSKSKLPVSDFVINPYVGCPHGCKYCYASFMKRFTNHEEEWGTFVDVKYTDKKIQTKKLHGKTIFLSSVTDCYNPLEEKYKRTRDILQELINVDCQIDISTKSKLILRDIEILKKLKHVRVAISINTTDETFKNDMDQASSIKDRLYTLKELHQNGIYTILFMSPIFPLITDWKKIIELSKEYVDEYWFENLNLRGSYKKEILNYINQKYPDYYETYLNIFQKKEKIFWSNLIKEIESFCKENKITYQNFFYHEQIVKK